MTITGFNSFHRKGLATAYLGISTTVCNATYLSRSMVYIKDYPQHRNFNACTATVSTQSTRNKGHLL